MTDGLSLDDGRRMLAAAAGLLARALAHAQTITEGGRRLDDHQVLVERVASHATELRATRDVLASAAALDDAGWPDPLLEAQAIAYTAEAAHRLLSEAVGALESFGLSEWEVGAAYDGAVRTLIRAGRTEARFQAIGRAVIAARGVNNTPLGDDTLDLTRRAVRDFARAEVAPLAQHIHQHDELVPDDLIRKMAAMGLFAAAVPEQYGGTALGYPAVAVTTEELCAASLGAAGSLATRPEMLIRALLAGGTERQRQTWLPRIASGERLVAIAVTEPDTGSDVAALRTRAERAEVEGRQGWRITGTKAWSTFAGRAEVIALLARSDPDPSKGARGLSLFIVEKEPAYGHRFEQRGPGGGLLSGAAIATPGYRGMHSFILSFEDWFVPAENVVGEEGGVGRGFYLQMGGFAVGRLQTGARATGVAQAALEATARYVSERRQFGRPIGDYPLTQYKLGRMATQIAAARQLTYAAARALDRDEAAALEGAMAKLLASDVAVAVTQEGQLLHGGWGYAEETPIARHVVDALVLPIFEGVKPILELRVIGRALLAGGARMDLAPWPPSR